MRSPAYFLLVLCVACAHTTPSNDLDSHMAKALATRAEELLKAGEDERARSTAERALARATASGTRSAEARALHVLGLIDDDLALLQRALQLLEDVTPSPALWSQRSVLAELALDQRRPEECLALVNRSLKESGDWPTLEPRMRSEATLHHLRARALRQLERHEDAFSAERQANLALSVLHDSQALPLRHAVAQALGEAYAKRGAFTKAFEQHSRASSLAHSLGETESEFDAIRWMCRDLANMGRWIDATDHAQRGMILARRELSSERVRELALEALSWLEGNPAAEALARRTALLAALDELREAGE